MNYTQMFTPLRVGEHILKNRVVMSSMHTRLEYLSNPIERETAFYAERARGGAALLITAGYSPNDEGRLEEGSHTFDCEAQVEEHLPVTHAVHAYGTKMLLQILHAGRYAKHARLVAPSPLRSPINKRVPRELTDEDIEQTIENFVETARLAQMAGYDGVEVMGSEGYLLNQFMCLRANQRIDAWGGTLEKRCRMLVEIVSRIRRRLGTGFLLAYRISALDLIADGLRGDEVAQVARAIEAAGADMLTTGIGWHESPVPTIAYQVPRAAWRFATSNLKRAVQIPVSASNRINTPEMVEDIISSGAADLVALARPLLADPEFVAKAASGRSEEINTCIACNQACLDYIFADRSVSCLVNPRAGREIEYNAAAPALQSRRVVIIGSGPAGLACAWNAAARGHQVTVYEAQPQIGGQLNLANKIPGKTEFNELLRFLGRQLALHRVELHLSTKASVDLICAGAYDHVVIAAGTEPRSLGIEGADHPKVLGYIDVIEGRARVGERVAIVGMGGVGHDVAELLLDEPRAEYTTDFFTEWGVDIKMQTPGGLAVQKPYPQGRAITMFQRSSARPGSRLGVSTGWILRRRLDRHGVRTVFGVTYRHIDDRGLHYSIEGVEHTAEVDNIIVCAGQEPANGLASELKGRVPLIHAIGGASFASELDAARAIKEGTDLALTF